MTPALGEQILTVIPGEQHRRQRKMLNPLFSAKHLREMTPIFTGIIHKVRSTAAPDVYHRSHCTTAQLEDAITARVKDSVQEIDVLNWMGRTALELIGQGGLGHSFDPLTEDVADEFAESVKAYL